MGTSEAQWSSVSCEAGGGGAWLFYNWLKKITLKFLCYEKTSNTQNRKNSEMNFHVTLALFNNEWSYFLSVFANSALLLHL